MCTCIFVTVRHKDALWSLLNYFGEKSVDFLRKGEVRSVWWDLCSLPMIVCCGVFFADDVMDVLTGVMVNVSTLLHMVQRTFASSFAHAAKVAAHVVAFAYTSRCPLLVRPVPSVSFCHFAIFWLHCIRMSLCADLSGRLLCLFWLVVNKPAMIG